MSEESSQNKQLLLTAILFGGVLILAGAFWLFGSGGQKPPVQTESAGASPPAVKPDDPRRFKPPEFAADFSTAAQPNFSDNRISAAKDGRRYLGPFQEGGVVFTLLELPQHRFVHVTFDLVLTRSWNGSNRNYGPDEWLVEVAGGTKLLGATFSNCGFFSDNNEQSYPDTFPPPPYVPAFTAWTGASEKQTIGVYQSWSATNTFDCSSVYKMDWTFPHTASKLELNFYSEQELRHDKSFGLMSLKVEPVSGPTPLSDADAQSAWTNLAATDPVAANALVWKLIASGDQAISIVSNPLSDAPKTWPTTPYEALRISRVRHVLEVLNTDQSKQLLASLPDPPDFATAPPTRGNLNARAPTRGPTRGPVIVRGATSRGAIIFPDGTGSGNFNWNTTMQPATAPAGAP